MSLFNYCNVATPSRFNWLMRNKELQIILNLFMLVEVSTYKQIFRPLTLTHMNAL
jgi:hypothetical protein